MKVLHVGTNIVLLSVTLALAVGVYSVAIKTKATIEAPPTKQAKVAGAAPEPILDAPLYEGHFVVVNLHTMSVELRDGSTTLDHMEILNIGKPGSYYETIGGAYENDYKIRNHFSSIGHVYMPWSVHVFGNFFIHGIPYYEDGTKVSSEYSGGCIRLSDENAKKIYDFIEKGTPIVITEQDERDFAATATSTDHISSMDMTRLMAATVSLEVLTQDNKVFDPISDTYTTRRKLLPRLIKDRESAVIGTLAHDRGSETFLMYMNMKAKSLGLTNTTFTSIDKPAVTTEEDAKRFNNYIAIYKTYLTGLQ